MPEDHKPQPQGQPEDTAATDWPQLMARLGQAAERLQAEEGFGQAELLAAQPWMEGWAWQAGLKETWTAMNQWRDWSEQLAPRTQTLVKALHMLLADMAVSAKAGQRQDDLAPQDIWIPEVLYERLRLYYLLGLWGTPPGSYAQAASVFTMANAPLAAEDDASQQRVARRWESELLPMAIGLVLNGARLLVPGEVWRQLAQGRYNSRWSRKPMSQQGRRLVEQISEVLPEAVALLHERCRGIFREVEPSRWENLKPEAEEVAMIIRARLYSRWPAGQGLQPGPDYPPGPVAPQIGHTVHGPSG